MLCVYLRLRVCKCVCMRVCVRVSTVISFLADSKSAHSYLVTVMTASGIMERCGLNLSGRTQPTHWKPDSDVYTAVVGHRLLQP